MIVLEVFLFVFNCSTQCVSVCVRFILSLFSSVFYWIHPQSLLCLFHDAIQCLWRLKQFLLNCFVVGFFFLFFLSFSICLSEKFHSSYCQRLCFFARSLSLALFLYGSLAVRPFLLLHFTVSVRHIRLKMNKPTDVTFTVIYNAI